MAMVAFYNLQISIDVRINRKCGNLANVVSLLGIIVGAEKKTTLKDASNFHGVFK